MGPYAAGQVVFLPFPFSNLSRNKLRPVLLRADAGNSDWIACQITSNPYIDSLAIPIDSLDLATGGLRHLSYVRSGNLFTANESLVAVTSGELNPDVLKRVRDAVTALVQS